MRQICVLELEALFSSVFTAYFDLSSYVLPARFRPVRNHFEDHFSSE
jgi:hypothetical protein